jgi:UDP:flavonoid glycosyltransferase YjiC (YdhE family)
MARILSVACANPGSLFPAVPIALELTRRGHELTVLCVPSSQKTFESLGLGFRPARELARHLRRFDFGAYDSIRDARSAWHAGSVRQGRRHRAVRGLLGLTADARGALALLG